MSISPAILGLLGGTFLAFQIHNAHGESNPPKEFGPGVFIDWSNKSVEVAATVVFRKGPLELAACSPQTREHESILSVAARPMHIHQAMGLIGLEPGSPARYADKQKKWSAPRGSPLQLSVRFADGEKTREVSLDRWMVDAETNKPVDGIPWVFAGSRSLDSGRYGADSDGTIVCVVDFETAMIAVADLHTPDNQALWLMANTTAIPPIGTRCTLVIRGRSPVPIEVLLHSDGTLHRNEKPVTADQLARSLTATIPQAQHQRVILVTDYSVSKEAVQAVIKQLADAGIAGKLIDVHRIEKIPNP